MEKERAAGGLSPCSELLQQHAPLGENSSTAQDPRGTRLVRGGGNIVQIPKMPRKQVSRAKWEWSPKAGVGIGKETSSSISWAIVDFASGYASRLATSNTVVEFSCSWINNSPWTSGFEFVFAILLMLLFEVNRRIFFPGKVLFILILLNRFFPPFYQLIL